MNLQTTNTAFQVTTIAGQTTDRFQSVRAVTGEYYVVDLANASVVETPAHLQMMTQREAHDLRTEWLYS